MYEYYNDDKFDVVDGKATISDVEEPKKKKKGKKIWSAIALGLIFGLVAGIVFCGVAYGGKIIESKLTHEDKNKSNEEIAKDAGTANKKNEKVKTVDLKTAENSDKKAALPTPGAGSLDVSVVANGCMPSIVSITNKNVQEVRSMFGRGSREYESTSCGSGIIVGQNDEELLIVTNNHVVEAATSITAGFIDEEVYEAFVKGTDEENDLAVIAVKLSDINDETMEKIKIAKMGNSDSLIIGQQVVAIGNALGYGQSVTTGIISALDREVELENICSKLIQTDAAINPGNSGGALLNMSGDVIGINSAKFASSQVEGMGYAIPISTATPIIEELMNRETREKVSEKNASYIGISGMTVSKDISEAYGIPQGIYVSESIEDGPADEAGIVKGDIICKLDDVTVTSMDDLKEQLLYYEAGETVDVVIKRGNGNEYEEKTLSVKLGKKSESNIDEPEDDDDLEESDDRNEYYEYGFGDDSIFGFDPFSFFGY